MDLELNHDDSANASYKLGLSTLVTGGTGFVGQKLVARLGEPLICSRSPAKASQSLGLDESRVVGWDTRSPFPVLGADQRVTHVVNLMGESIAKGRWNEAKKQRIRDSRVLGTRNLVDGLIAQDSIPDVFVSASAIGFYGDSGEAVVDEQHPVATGFLPEVCQQWEAEALRLQDHGTRVVCLRIGLVLGQDDGVIGELAPVFRWGVGGRLGNGQQWMAWIHVEDLVNLILFALKTDTLRGPVNATSPNPERNKTFTQTLASAVNRPAFIPVPWFLLRVVLGEFANSLFFSQRVIPQAAQDAGFKFQFTDLGDAINDLV